MSTNATTWFYAEPETGRPYFISERLTHTFWTNRLSSIYLTCTQATSPYRVVGDWRGQHVQMEWEVKNYFKLRTTTEEQGLIVVCSEVLGFRPTVSYTDPDGYYSTEWYLDSAKGKQRLQEIQGNPSYTNIRKNYR